MASLDWTVLGTPEGSTKTIRNIAIISGLMFLLIYLLSSGLAFIAVVFLIVSILNMRIVIKTKGYLAINNQTVGYRNNYAPLLNQSLGFADIGLVSIKRKFEKNGFKFYVNLRLKNGKKKTFIFQESYKEALRQFMQLLEAKGIEVKWEIKDEKKPFLNLAGGDMLVIYMPVWMLGQVLVLALIFWGSEYKEQINKASLLENMAYAVATTTDITNPNHGTCSFLYNFKANGRPYTGQSSICVDCSPNNKGLYKLRDTGLKVQKAGAQFMVVYKKDEPSTHYFLIDRPIKTPADSIMYVEQGVGMEDLD